MRAVIAIDQGTTGSTVLVFGEDGRVLGRAYAEFPQYYPEPGWVEHDAEEIWHSVERVTRAAVAQARRETPDLALAAIGITNQRETVVVWDRRTGRPVHRAIVWQDRRTSERCRALQAAGREAWVRDRTGLVLDPYFSATKLEWLLENVPGLRARAEAGELAAGTIDTWLTWRLTGGRSHVTDPSNAARTLLFNIDTLDWDEELLAQFTVPRPMLPEIRPSSAVYGYTSSELLGEEIPVAGSAGDQQAALFGQGCCTAGLAKNTYGTGAFLLLQTGPERVHSSRGLLTTVACGSRGEPAYALEGSIFIAGAAIQWLRDGLGLVGSAAETEAIARSLAGNDGVYFVPAFVGLGAPYWNPEARGTIVGLTRGTGKAHLVRAALEAMAYATVEVLEAMEADAGVRTAHLAVDGGASQNDWLMQFQADLLDTEVRRPHLVETTALGAAGLAGIAIGIWRDADEFLATRAAPTHFRPHMAAAERGALRRGWNRAVSTALAWAAHK